MLKGASMGVTRLPRSGKEREALRARGQFWTPDWIADFMVAYVLRPKPTQMLDPAIGGGAFFRAAKRYAIRNGFAISLFGRDVDPGVLSQARDSGLSASDLSNVEIRDFVLDPPTKQFPAIVVNPPYIRHHRLSERTKAELRAFALKTTGHEIDGRAGLHVYFLIQALNCLSPYGRLACIVSADVCEGVFAQKLWRWISTHYRLDAVVTFSPEASPFPDVDTNALIFLIANERPRKSFQWARCKARHAKELLALTDGDARTVHSDSVEMHMRSLSEGIATGLSRFPSHDKPEFRLGDFASVMRGIVTGNNDFFFMTSHKARKLGIPFCCLARAIGRTRDVAGEMLTQEHVDALDAAGRPTWLLSVNRMPFDQLPNSVQQYLRSGESAGLPEKTLIKTRKPWYRVETRRVPPILFAYLGRRNARFIRNYAGVVPLTCLLCVYPRYDDPAFIETLWRVLSHPKTIGNLRKVGKSYGADAIKVEPRALERLPLPEDVVSAQGLESWAIPTQGTLGFAESEPALASDSAPPHRARHGRHLGHEMLSG